MTDTESIERLKKEIIERLGRNLESPSDYDFLARKVKESTGEDISALTFKRFFGYVPYQGTPRTSTLAILARYLGYKGWSDYQDSQEGKLSSRFSDMGLVLSSELKLGDRVKVSWYPDREVTFQYLLDNRFRVLESLHAKILADDEMTILMFALGEPVHALNIMRQETSLGNYVAGLGTGLTQVSVFSEK